MVFPGCRVVIDAFRALLVALLTGGMIGVVQATDTVYVTWSGMEPDKCASIWLIRRHIDPGARFEFFPRDEQPPAGILFDTADAEIRRTHSQSTFEVLMRRQRLDDPRIRYIARLIHDIEINTWRRKALAETQTIMDDLRREIGFDTREDVVSRCVRFFDGLPILEGSSNPGSDRDP